MGEPDRDDQMEEDIDVVIAMCGGNFRKTIRALVIINGVLMEENARLEAVIANGPASEVKKRAG